VSVTLTVKVAEPAALGVPLTVIVPAVASVVMTAAVRPVVPPLKLFTAKVVYGWVPPLTVIVWL